MWTVEMWSSPNLKRNNSQHGRLRTGRRRRRSTSRSGRTCAAGGFRAIAVATHCLSPPPFLVCVLSNRPQEAEEYEAGLPYLRGMPEAFVQVPSSPFLLLLFHICVSCQINH